VRLGHVLIDQTIYYFTRISSDVTGAYIDEPYDMKHCLKGVSFCSKEELFLEIHVALRGISFATLLAAFEDWMERLVWLVIHECHYSS
jgi:hypothetical protein